MVNEVRGDGLKHQKESRSIGADSEEKHEPASDNRHRMLDSLKVLDPEGPIREADMARIRQLRPLPH